MSEIQMFVFHETLTKDRSKTDHLFFKYYGTREAVIAQVSIILLLF